MTNPKFDLEALEPRRLLSVAIGVITVPIPATLTPEASVITVPVSGNLTPESSVPSAVVAQNTITNGTGLTVTEVTGQNDSNSELGTFIYNGAVHGQFVVQVDWGDAATPSDGAYVPTNTSTDNSGNTVYSVWGMHPYANPGNYTAQITVSICGHATAPPGEACSALAWDMPVAQWTSNIVVTGQPLTEIAGQNFTENLGAFDCAAPAGAQMIALINWGDGSADSDGTIVDNGTATSQYNVLGSHNYATTGNYHVSITVGYITPGSAGNVVIVNSWTTAAKVQGLTINEVAGQQFTATLGQLAYWMNPDSCNMGVGIDWGDGTPISEATLVVNTADSTITVQGTHTYAASGNYTIQISGTGFPKPGGPGEATPCICWSLGQWNCIANVTDQAPASTVAASATPIPASTVSTAPLIATPTSAGVLSANQDPGDDLGLLADNTDISV